MRTAVLLTLVGAKADEVLAKAGMATGGGAIAKLALGKLPPAALMVVNKAVGFRLMRGVFERVFSRFGRGVPFLGGVIGAVVDGWMMKRIAEQALVEFPRGPDLGRQPVSKDETPFSDQIKKVVDDLDLETKVREATAAAEQAVVRGLDATGSYLREHRGDIEGFLERAGRRPSTGRPAVGTPTRSSRCVASSSAGVASLADREWGAQTPAPPAELPAAERGPRR